MTQHDINPPAMVVIHPIALLTTPALGATVRALLASGDRLIPTQARDGFVEVQTATGQHGFVPAAACTPLAIGTAESVSDIKVAQPIALYRNPIPGTQFVVRSQQDARSWIILPEDQLVLLGRDQAFVLVQCIDGRIGYIPAGVCGLDKDPEAFIPIGPIDIGWIVLGGAWFVPNWLVVKNELWAGSLIVISPSIYLDSLVVLSIAAALWWLGSGRIAARSFALGIAIAYIALLMQ